MTDDEPNASRTEGGDPDELEATLRRRREPFARATVVRREPPISANVGDRAVVTAEGDIEGWIGGVACAQRAVTTEALDALADGQPRLVGLAPDPDAVDRPGVVAHRMTCHSEGTLEVFVEPVTPRARLAVVGDSPVARSLRRLATELPLEVLAVRPSTDERDSGEDRPADETVVPTIDPDEIAERVGDRSLVVVASMGEYDARGVAAGVLADAAYVGLIASDERAEEVAKRAAGLTDRDVEAVREAITNPAGVDIAARSPSEIAVSVLAEIVDVTGAEVDPEADRGSTSDSIATEEPADAEAKDAAARCCGESIEEGAGETHPGDDTDAGEEPDERTAAGEPDDETDRGPTIDPVCGMTVEPDETTPTVEFEGETYHFCCHGCADSFRADPTDYLESTEGEASLETP